MPTLMITEQQIRDYTNIPANLDSSIFCNHIFTAQHKYIKPYIGETCFKELLNQIENDTLTTANTTLLDGDDRNFPGLRRSLAWWVLYLAMPWIASRIVPIGIVNKISDSDTPVGENQLATLNNAAKNNAEIYGDLVVCYIKENSEDYPCYESADCDCTNIVTSGYQSSGIVTDGDILDKHKLGKLLNSHDINTILDNFK